MRSFAGMVGILALVAACIIGALAATGVLSAAATNAGVGGSRVETKTAEGKSKTVQLDKTVKAGDLTWHISKARKTHELHTYTYPKSSARGDFIVIDFSVKNTSDGPITLSEEDMALRDKATGIVGGPLAGGPAASVNGEYVPPTKDILFSEERLLAPGEKKQGRVNFDLSVPFGQNPTTDLKGFELVLGDGNPNVKEEKSLDLGL